MTERKPARISGQGLISSLMKRGIIGPADDTLAVKITLDFRDPEGWKLIELLEEQGIIGPTHDMRSVVIEAVHDDVVLVHTEQLGTTKLLEVPFDNLAVKTIDQKTPRSGVEVTRVGINLDKYR